MSSLPAILKALMRGKVTPAGALKPHKIPKGDLKSVQSIYEKIEGRPRRYELNLYISGQDEEPAPAEAPDLLAAAAGSGDPPGAPENPEESVSQ